MRLRPTLLSIHAIKPRWPWCRTNSSQHLLPGWKYTGISESAGLWCLELKIRVGAERAGQEEDGSHDYWISTNFAPEVRDNMWKISFVDKKSYAYTRLFPTLWKLTLALSLLTWNRSTKK